MSRCVWETCPRPRDHATLFVMNTEWVGPVEVTEYWGYPMYKRTRRLGIDGRVVRETWSRTCSSKPVASEEVEVQDVSVADTDEGVL